jgi:hypothetical protein
VTLRLLDGRSDLLIEPCRISDARDLQRRREVRIPAGLLALELRCEAVVCDRTIQPAPDPQPARSIQRHQSGACWDDQVGIAFPERCGDGCLERAIAPGDEPSEQAHRKPESKTGHQSEFLCAGGILTIDEAYGFIYVNP